MAQACVNLYHCLSRVSSNTTSANQYIRTSQECRPTSTFVGVPDAELWCCIATVPCHIGMVAQHKRYSLLLLKQ